MQKTKTHKILFISGNAGKIAEARAITGFDIRAKDLGVPEIQDTDPEIVASEKALAAYALAKQPVLVDDVSLSIDAWGGLPGPFITWFLKAMGTEGILRLMKNEKNRSASVTACIAYADRHGARVFRGTAKGSIATKARGQGGFGFDPIFVPKGSSKTYGEMDQIEKNRRSMRKIAWMKFKKFYQTLD